jgi:hypothetical protein
MSDPGDETTVDPVEPEEDDMDGGLSEPKDEDSDTDEGEEETTT